MATLTNTQQTVVRFRAKNRRGQEAGFDGVPEWSTDNTDVLYLEPAEDGKSCQVVALGPIGRANVTMQADADLGDGVRSIVGTIDFDVTPGEATVIELVPDPASEQPDEEPVPAEPEPGEGPV